MGFLSGLLGGGSTKVSQSSSTKVTTNVDVGVENIIDTTQFADAIREFAVTTGQTYESVRDLIGQLVTQNQIELDASGKNAAAQEKLLALGLINTQLAANKNDQEISLFKRFYALAFGGVVLWFGWKFWRG